MGCCKSQPQDTTRDSAIRAIQYDGKLYNENVTVRKGMKTGAQLGRTDDGDFDGGFQIMFSKRKVKNYTQSIPAVSE